MSESVSETAEIETPPRPSEILDEDRIAYQAMTDLSDDEYRRLAEDIRDRGVLQPIVVDESETILDGHHRAALAEWLELDASRDPAYVVLGDLDGVGAKLARAIKQNVIGRDSTDAVKSHAVKQYIETAWDRTDDGDLIRPETDTEVAEKLGVSQQLVNQVIKNTNSSTIYHDRVKARRYYEEHPDASYREVARQVDASQPTVTEWLKEDFDEGDDDGGDEDDTSLTAFARDVSEVEQVSATLNTATDAGADPEVREAAAEAAESVARNETTPDEAADAVEKTEEIVEDEQRRERQREDFAAAVEASNAVDIHHGDFADVLNNYDDASIDHIVTDPPYDETALEAWDNLGRIAADVLPDGGLVAAYTGQYYLDEVFATLSEHLEYFWQFVVTHEQPNYFIKHDIGIKYKPVVVFGKSPVGRPERQAHDVLDAGAREKSNHDWEQPVAEAATLIEALTEPNEVICDPMCGSGTTGVAALRSKRQAVLIDRDSDAIETATERVGEAIRDE